MDISQYLQHSTLHWARAVKFMKIRNQLIMLQGNNKTDINPVIATLKQ